MLFIDEFNGQTDLEFGQSDIIKGVNVVSSSDFSGFLKDNGVV